MMRRFGKSLVLTVGDEGAALFLFAGRRVAASLFAAEGDARGTDQLLACVGSLRRTPVTLLLDTSDQAYRQETLPPVNFIDRRRLLRRRERGFAAGMRYCASLPLDGGGAGQERRYVFAGVPSVPSVEGWLDRLAQYGSRVEGIALLPLEAGAIAAALSDDATANAWIVLLTRNRTSGLRQLVFRRGVPVLARATPSQSEAPEAVAETLAAEYHRTLGYLDRHGLASGDSIHAIILAEPRINRLLAAEHLRATSVELLTPDEAGGLLGLPAAPESDGTSDFLFAAAAARFGPGVPLRPAEQDRLAVAPRHVYRLAGAAAVAGLAWAGVLRWDIEALEAERLRLEASRAAAEAAVAEAVSAAEDLPASPDRLAALIDAWRAVADDARGPDRWLAILADALAADFVATQVTWRIDDDRRPVLVAALRHADSDDADFLAASARLTARLDTAFAPHSVTVSDPRFAANGGRPWQGEAGLTVREDAVPPPLRVRIEGRGTDANDE